MLNVQKKIEVVQNFLLPEVLEECMKMKCETCIWRLYEANACGTDCRFSDLIWEVAQNDNNKKDD